MGCVWKISPEWHPMQMSEPPHLAPLDADEVVQGGSGISHGYNHLNLACGVVLSDVSI